MLSHMFVYGPITKKMWNILG